ncbi:MAG: hypothetical protein JNL01_15950 [Bdellovibrionales bacterium]|nr:hypothetical protein [Bdellovibrionales bacterium]
MQILILLYLAGAEALAGTQNHLFQFVSCGYVSANFSNDMVAYTEPAKFDLESNRSSGKFSCAQQGSKEVFHLSEAVSKDSPGKKILVSDKEQVRILFTESKKSEPGIVVALFQKQSTEYLGAKICRGYFLSPAYRDVERKRREGPSPVEDHPDAL